MLPSDHARRVLLLTVGLTPQVVTETLFALIRSQIPGERFVPTEIHIITTAEGRRRILRDLLDPDHGRFYRLCHDYKLATEAIRLNESTIHQIIDANGSPFDDIRSIDHNNVAADCITNVVRDLTSDPATALHVSLAGGRKTMGFYLGYALSLFGRPQDRLSHVLVGEQYEGAKDFYYPTPYSQILESRQGNRTFDARDATVTLATIPFISLRSQLPRELIGESPIGYSEIVARAQDSINPIEARLSVDQTQATVHCNGLAVAMSGRALIWYCWFAQRAHQGSAFVDWRKPHPDLLELAERIKDKSPGWRADVSAWFSPTHPGQQPQYLERDALDRAVNAVNAALRKALGPGPAKPFLIQKSGSRGHAVYGLQLLPQQITLIPIEVNP